MWIALGGLSALDRSLAVKRCELGVCVRTGQRGSLHLAHSCNGCVMRLAHFGDLDAQSSEFNLGFEVCGVELAADIAQGALVALDEGRVIRMDDDASVSHRCPNHAAGRRR